MARRYDVGRRRSALAKWTGRVLGLAGTAAVLGVGVVSATMVVAGDDDQVVTSAPAATPTPKPHAKQSKGKRKPGLSGRQRRQRRHAVDAVRRLGYAPVKLADYRADHVLRVLIGRPVGTTPPGRRAFFFVRGRYVGQDAARGSLKLRPGRQLEREITIVYTLYEPGNRKCCPKGGDERVHFRWTGAALAPREQIPPDFQRMPYELAET